MLRHKFTKGLGVWYTEALCQGMTIGFSEVLLIVWYSHQMKDPIHLGVILTAPTALGALTQVAATRYKKYFGGASGLAIGSIAVQILGLLAIAYALRFDNLLSPTLIVGQCLYWMGAMTATSPTQEILAHAVPASEHNRFFSRRAMLITLVTLSCNFICAFYMDRSLTQTLLIQFILAAAAARGVSLMLMIQQKQPDTAQSGHSAIVIQPSNETMVSIFRLSLCMFLFRMSVNISSPFFSAYMLGTLALTFSVYSMLTAIPLVTKMLCLNNWARLLDDNRKFEGLALATMAIGLTPILWSMNTSLPMLGGLQVVSGISWSGFDLISVLLIQHMYPRNITSKLGLFLALGSLGSVAGGLLGGLLLHMNVTYQTVFVTSGVMRLVSGFLLLWYLRRHHLFRFHHLNLKHGLATLMTVRPSIEAAAKLLPLPSRRHPRRGRAA